MLCLGVLGEGDKGVVGGDGEGGEQSVDKGIKFKLSTGGKLGCCTKK